MFCFVLLFCLVLFLFLCFVLFLFFCFVLFCFVFVFFAIFIHIIIAVNLIFLAQYSVATSISRVTPCYLKFKWNQEPLQSFWEPNGSSHLFSPLGGIVDVLCF